MLVYSDPNSFSSKSTRAVGDSVKQVQAARQKIEAAEVRVIGLMFLLLLLVACATPTAMRDPFEATAESPLRVLLVGNSIIFHPEDPDHLLNHLVGSSNPPVHFDTESIVLRGVMLDQI
jgi:hypothetical protein